MYISYQCSELQLPASDFSLLHLQKLQLVSAHVRDNQQSKKESGRSPNFHVKVHFLWVFYL